MKNVIKSMKDWNCLLNYYLIDFIIMEFIIILQKITKIIGLGKLTMSIFELGGQIPGTILVSAFH